MKTVVSLSVVAALAGAASGHIIVPSSNAVASPIDFSGGDVGARDLTPVYSGIPGPYSGFAAAAGQASVDDYTTTAPGPSVTLANFQFVGGVVDAGGSLTVNFYDSTSTLANSFSVTLPNGGDFVWTITLGPGDGSTSTFAVPSAGFAEMVVDDATTGRWFFTTTAPTVGANDVATGTGSVLSPQRNNAFAMTAVPAPASLALLGIGGLLGTRRRR